MFRFELTTYSTAPREALFDLSLDVDAHVASLAGTNERAVAERNRVLVARAERPGS